MVTPLFTENSTPMWIVGKDSLNILDVNNAAVESYGYNKKEFLTKTLGDLQPKAKIASKLGNQARLSRKFERIGFQQTEKGVIQICVTDDNDTIEMCIKDNGNGLPSGFDPNNTSTLGYTIINTLVQQLEAAIHIESNEGTKVSITFDKADAKGSSSAFV